MTSSERRVPGRRRKMHPLFAELYLSGDAEEEQRDDRQTRRKKRAARVRTNSGGTRDGGLLPAEITVSYTEVLVMQGTLCRFLRIPLR
jgi:hypothetical protein